MKKKKVIIALSTLLAVSLLATGCGKEIEVKNGSKVAVSTSGGKITATEYYEQVKEKNSGELIDMIDHSLFDKKYKTTDEETESINNQIDQIKAYSGDNEDTYQSLLKQYFGVETEDELREMLSLEYKRKLAVEDYLKDDLKENEINDYYEKNITGQIKASHILITIDTKEDAPEDEKAAAEQKAKETAEEVIKQLKKGKKFATLAKKYSKDTATASNGGDLGYFYPDTMVEEFRDAVKELKKDEYTKEPVKTKYGYHIILRTGEKDKPKLEEVKEDIINTLVSEKLSADASLYYETLKNIHKKKKISFNDDVLKKAYNNYMDKLIENAKQNS